MATERQKIIAEMMNSLCLDRQFTALEVALIDREVHSDRAERHNKGIKIDFRKKTERAYLNRKTADTLNEKYKPKQPLRAEHIRLYKRCTTDEYAERTGKCPYGFAEYRVRMGYDPVTGMGRW